MDKSLRLSVFLTAWDRVSKPLRGIGNASSKLRKDVKATAAELADLGKQRKLLDSFKALKGSVGELDDKLAGARQRATALGREISQVEKPTQAMARAFKKARDEVSRLEQQHRAEQRELNATRGAMAKAGIEATEYASHQKRIKDQTAAATKALDAQKDRLRQLDAQHARRAKAGALAGKISGVQGQAAMVGVSAGGTAMAVGRPMLTAAEKTREFRQGQTQIGIKAGLGRPEKDALTKQFLAEAQQYNRFPEEVQAGFDTLVSRGMDVKTARAMSGQISKAATAWQSTNEDVAAANFSVKKDLGVDAGRANDMLGVGGKAGAFEVQDMATELPNITSSFKALGATGDRDLADLIAGLQAVRANTADSSTAANNLKNVLDKVASPEVEKNFKKYGVDLRAGMIAGRKAGKPLLDIITELTDKATGGDDSKLGYIFGDVQARDGVRALKQNRDLLQKVRQDALAAHGAVDQDFKTQMGDSAQKQKALQVSTGVAQLRAGAPVADLQDQAAGPLGEMATKFGEFADKHPGLVKLAAIMAVVLAVVGVLAIAFAALLAPFLLFAAVAAAGLWPIIGIVALVGAGIAILIAIIVQLVNAFKGAAAHSGAAWQWIKDQASNFMTWFNQLPTVFQTIGRAMIEGLIIGMKAMFPGLGAAISLIGKLMPDGLKKKLGIHSPSRVFAAIGGHTMSGLQEGIRAGQRGPLDQIRATAGRLTAAMVLGSAVPAGAAGQAQAGAPAGAITINVYPSAGMDEKALANLVRLELGRAQTGVGRRAAYDDDAD